MSAGTPIDECVLPPAQTRALFAAGAALVALGLLVHGAGLDPAWLLQVHAYAPPPLFAVVWSCVTVLGLGWSALILVLAADRGRGAVAALLVPTFLLGSVLTHLPKMLLAVPRPAATSLLPQLHVIGDAFRGPVSMPSGHALTAAATVALLCVAVARARRRGAAVAAVLAFAAVVVGWSRVVVGAHWPSDVFAGAGLGLVAVALAQVLAGWTRTRHLHLHLVERIRSRRGQRWVAVAELAAAAGLLTERTGYPAGRPMVLALAVVAILSASWRFHVSTLPAALPQPRKVPAGPYMSASLHEPTVDAPPRASATPWRVARFLLALLLCGIAWWWLLRHVDLKALTMKAAELPAWAWLAAGAALTAGHGARALRLQSDWRHVRFVPWWQCLRIVLAHNALILVLPLRSGEAGYLWAVRRQWGVPWRAAGLGLLRWRLQDAAVLCAFAVALMAPLSLPWRLLAAVASAAFVHRLLPPVWSWLLARTGGECAGLPAGRSPWSGITASTVNWALKVLANGGLLAALAGLPLEAAWRAALGGELAGVQPLQPPVGLGTYEAGTWLAAAQPASLAPRVVAAALAVHAFSLAVALTAAALTQLALAPRRITQEPCP